MVSTATAGFSGTPRFRLVSRLGQGSGGIVYEALDRERGTHVALKTLDAMTAESLLQLKKEFRALADLEHPNLVRFGELFEEAGQWFFTMELVRGVTILEYVRAPNPTEARLRETFAQLVRGLDALHRASKVHRDVKPSNVLVTTEGRVVLLDFGVVSDVVQLGANDAHAARYARAGVRAGDGMLGTVAYMAPEQAASEDVGPAADFYAMGVVLYEALTGATPFAGERSGHAVLEAKISREPPAPRTLAPTVPADLDALCVDLLKLDPDERPDAAEIQDRLRVRRDRAPVAAQELARGVPSGVFVGRRRELAELEEALAATRGPNGHAVSVVVTGESGVGKSSVVRRFASELGARDPNAVLLVGRCYERESVPFKAIDDLIDDLASFLLTLSEDVLRDLVPADAPLIARIFPVIEQVHRCRRSGVPFELVPQQMRERVFGALRELLARVARRAPVVLVIEDLQWTDADSLALLRAVLLPPGAPQLLLVVTQRTASGDDARRDGRDASDPSPSTGLALGGDVRTVPVALLPPHDAELLVRTLLREATAANTNGCADDGERARELPSVRAIAAEAHGHPLFIDELVRQRASFDASRDVRLDDALWERITQLDPAARRLLELLAIAGVPISQELAAAAALETDGDVFEPAAALRNARLVATDGTRRENRIGCYHDRVRESVLAHIDDATAKLWHERLARALERAGSVDHEMLGRHWRACGELTNARKYTALAAGDAARALAFDRAAALYQEALALAPNGAAPAVAVTGAADETGLALAAELATALTNAGRSAEAAAVRLDLARRSPKEEAVTQRRVAAEQLLCSGHFDAGLEALRAAIADVGMSYPRSPLRALVLVIVLRLALRLRGLAFAPREASAAETRADAARRRRLDCAWSAGSGLLMTDNIRGVYFQTWNLLESLRFGERGRVLRALAWESLAGGSPNRTRSEALIATARRLSSVVDTPYGHAMVSASEGGVAYFWGEWARALPLLTHSEAAFRDRCIGATFELSSTRLMLYRVLGYRGRLCELTERVAPILRDAERRNDRYALVNIMAAALSLLAMAKGDTARVREELAAAYANLSGGGFHVQHYLCLYALAQIDLHGGKAREAYARATSTAKALRRALLMRVGIIRIQSTDQRARAAIALATSPAGSADARSLLAEAEAHADALAKEAIPWACALERTVRAGIANARGDRTTATRLLDDAARALDDASMELHAVAARYVAARLGGGPRDAAAQEAAARMAEEGVVDVDGMVNLLVPGFAA